MECVVIENGCIIVIKNGKEDTYTHTKKTGHNWPDARAAFEWKHSFFCYFALLCCVVCTVCWNFAAFCLEFFSSVWLERNILKILRKQCKQWSINGSLCSKTNIERIENTKQETWKGTMERGRQNTTHTNSTYDVRHTDASNLWHFIAMGSLLLSSIKWMELKWLGEKRVNRNEERRLSTIRKEESECVKERDADVTDCIHISKRHFKNYTPLLHASRTLLFAHFFGWLFGRFVLKFVLSDWSICWFAFALFTCNWVIYMHFSDRNHWPTRQPNRPHSNDK